MCWGRGTYKGLVSVNGLIQLGLLLAAVEVRILSSHRDPDTKAPSFLMMTLQRNVFQVLEKDPPEF